MKLEMSCSQGSRGSMMDPMSHHLPDLRREASEPIGNARPRRQHHHNGGDRRLMKRRVTLATGLHQGSRGTRLGGCTILLAGNFHQLPGQTLADLPQLCHLSLHGS